jgi:ribosomal protein S18 acetylase RimI-like enzyme
MTRTPSLVFQVRPYAAIAAPDRLDAALDHVFFVSSNTKSFPNDELRRQFRDRWLGRYLRQNPHEAFLAFDAEERLAGYVIGSLTDPATEPRFADIGYFPLLADRTLHYPAHLHINLAPTCRGIGLGSLLIDRFAAHAVDRGAPGVHVVTSDGARNVGFYRRNGFEPIRTFLWNGSVLVMLGRKLHPAR